MYTRVKIGQNSGIFGPKFNTFRSFPLETLFFVKKCTKNLADFERKSVGWNAAITLFWKKSSGVAAPDKFFEDPQISSRWPIFMRQIFQKSSQKWHIFWSKFYELKNLKFLCEIYANTFWVRNEQKTRKMGYPKMLKSPENMIFTFWKLKISGKPIPNYEIFRLQFQCKLKYFEMHKNRHTARSPSIARLSPGGLGSLRH